MAVGLYPWAVVVDHVAHRAWLTGSAFAQENLRPDVPVALVGGQLLDGYEAEPIHHSVVLFENGRTALRGQRTAVAL